MTFESYLQQYHTEQTINSYVRSVQHFLDYSIKKNQSNYADILAYANKKNITTRDLSALKKYFDYQIQAGKRTDHPCKGLYIKSKKRAIQHQELLTREELASLLHRKERYQELVIRNKLILGLLIYQGLTPGNIVNLKIKHLDLENGTIYISATKTINRRTLELKPPQIMLFYKYIFKEKNSQAKDSPMFMSKLNQPITVDTINRMLRPLNKTVALKNVNAQTIRQSVISNWINEDNMAIEDVQLLSGQKWLSSVDKYKKEDVNKKLELINRFFPR